MRKLVSVVFAITTLVPFFALADSSIPVGPTAEQLLTRVAALEAQVVSLQNNQSLACAMQLSASTTPVDQQVILAWGSVGAVEQTKDTSNMRPTNGAVTLLFSQPGPWTYSFKFYDASGKGVACSARVVVSK